MQSACGSPHVRSDLFCQTSVFPGWALGNSLHTLLLHAFFFVAPDLAFVLVRMLLHTFVHTLLNRCLYIVWQIILSRFCLRICTHLPPNHPPAWLPH